MIVELSELTDTQLVQAARWASVEDESLDDFDVADKLTGEQRVEIIEKVNDLGYSHWNTIEEECA